MVADLNQGLVPIQFELGAGSSTKLQLGCAIPGAAGNTRRQPSALAVGGACSFSTRGSSKPLVCRGARARSRASPFASMSMGLAPFAAATMAKGDAKKGKEEEPAKRKKTLAEVMDYASKRALSGGIPGMVAMALQVLSLMWLR